MTATITEFLETRIAEDEESNGLKPDPSGYCDYLSGVHYEPARVLAECAAKRAIVEMHGPVKDDGLISGAAHGHLWCGMCGSVDDSPEPYPCGTLKALAAVYADHADYRQEWS